MQELSFAEIISYAKIGEDNAIAFYQNAAKKASRKEVRQFLEELVKMEQAHKKHLEELLAKFEKGKKVPKLRKAVQTLGYAEYIKPAAIDADSSYKDVLEAAMAKEREAVETYENLARLVDDPEAKQVFTVLHEEEKKHLMRFETEYDDLTNQNW
jgi:rubrerythrin